MFKIIFSTLSLTACSLLIISKFFLASVLGLFNLAAVPVETLASLNQSKQVVEKMKSRHQSKKKSLSKRFVKNSGKKIGVSAMSAATIGTVAVVGAITALEISEYCDEQASLMLDENILYDQNNTFDMNDCQQKAQEDVALIYEEAENYTTGVLKETWESVDSNVNDGWDTFVKETDVVFGPSRKMLSDLLIKYF